MITIACAALGIGYLLVYAAVHNGGEYAFRPWAALTENA